MTSLREKKFRELSLWHRLRAMTTVVVAMWIMFSSAWHLGMAIKMMVVGPKHRDITMSLGLKLKRLPLQRFDGDASRNQGADERGRATALVDIEPRLRKVMGYRHLPSLREALKRELKLETRTSTVSKRNVA